MTKRKKYNKDETIAILAGALAQALTVDTIGEMLDVNKTMFTLFWSCGRHDEVLDRLQESLDYLERCRLADSITKT